MTWTGDAERLQAPEFADCDLVEYAFASVEDADRADCLLAVPTIHVGTALAVRSRDLSPETVGWIENSLRHAGLSYAISPSGTSAADLWPEWPEDDVVSNAI